MLDKKLNKLKANNILDISAHFQRQLEVVLVVGLWNAVLIPSELLLDREHHWVNRVSLRLVVELYRAHAVVKAYHGVCDFHLRLHDLKVHREQLLPTANQRNVDLWNNKVTQCSYAVLVLLF